MRLGMSVKTHFMNLSFLHNSSSPVDSVCCSQFHLGAEKEERERMARHPS